MLLRLLFSHLLGAWLLLSFFPGELRAQNVGDIPMQLCGRDFIRAVIFTCGGSRWKRISMTEPKQMLVSHSDDVENGKLDLEFIPGWEEGQIPQLNGGWDKLKKRRGLRHTDDSTSSMEEFLIGSDEVKEAIEKNKNEIKATNPLEQYDFMWGIHPRKKREKPTGIAHYCCQSACTKSDIARLC
ncbi:prorelaxin-like [Dromiciops gliroides]|uniref:prorelaxin-like n=1 Tax=Dromiciops gliroides TaxID=33562 RepID=UPI001CC65E3A|nr:prorelaxin-like [Dromiciops gliroides]